MYFPVFGFHKIIYRGKKVVIVVIAVIVIIACSCNCGKGNKDSDAKQAATAEVISKGKKEEEGAAADGAKK